MKIKLYIICILTLLIYSANAQKDTIMEECGNSLLYRSLSDEDKKIITRNQQVNERQGYESISKYYLYQRSDFKEISKDSITLYKHLVKLDEDFIDGALYHINFNYGLYQSANISYIDSVSVNKANRKLDTNLKDLINEVLRSDKLIIEIFIILNQNPNSITEKELGESIIQLEKAKKIIVNDYPNLKDFVTILPFYSKKDEFHEYTNAYDLIILYTN